MSTLCHNFHDSDHFVRWKKVSFFINFLAVFKVLVGQGDPFMRRVLKIAAHTTRHLIIFLWGQFSAKATKIIICTISSPPQKSLRKKIFPNLSTKFTGSTRIFNHSFWLGIPYADFKNYHNRIMEADFACIISEARGLTGNQLLQSGSSLHPLLGQFNVAYKHFENLFEYF